MRTLVTILATAVALCAVGCAYEMPSEASDVDVETSSFVGADASVPEDDSVGSSAAALTHQCRPVEYDKVFREPCHFGGGWTREVRQHCQALTRPVQIRPGIVRCVIDPSTEVCATMYRGTCEPPIIQPEF